MKAWELEQERRRNAKPKEETVKGDWSHINSIIQNRQGILDMLWESEVPGSRAPESMFTEMIQAWHNRGYDVTEAEELLIQAWEAHASGHFGELERTTALIQWQLRNASVDPASPYWKYQRPDRWEEIKGLMPITMNTKSYKAVEQSEILCRIEAGWLGQIVGAAYGTALEGYLGSTLRRMYGDELDYYVKTPDTYNDDITYQLAFLTAASEKGTDITPCDIADKWLRLIPFGWSAEYFALENLRRGIYPPESGRFGNFFSEWIGAQMRTMVCGLVCPGDPLKAAYYAYMDSVVSHEKNGVYGGIHSAVLTSLAFVINDSRQLLAESRQYVPDGTQFAAIFDLVMESLNNHQNHVESWESLSAALSSFCWVHTYPNMAAVLHALWYCENSFDKALRILGDCGLDVDCNAGEVGTALGVMNPALITSKWTDPIGGIVKTYLPQYASLSIPDLSKWTYEVYQKLNQEA